MKKPIYLLDTNIISELSKPYPNKNIIEKFELNKDFCAISSTTWQELLYGLNILPSGKKADYLFDFIVNYIQTNLPIINCDNHCAWIQADIRARLKDAGIPVDYTNTEIASIAVSNQLILVTGNTKHFEPIRQIDTVFRYENWFEA